MSTGVRNATEVSRFKSAVVTATRAMAVRKSAVSPPREAVKQPPAAPKVPSSNATTPIVRRPATRTKGGQVRLAAWVAARDSKRKAMMAPTPPAPRRIGRSLIGLDWP